MKFYQKHKQLSMWIAAFIFVAAVLIFKETLSNLSIIFGAIGSFFEIISPFIAGFIIAFILYVPCNKIEKLLKKSKKPNFFSKHARGVSVLAVYLIGIAILTAVIALVIPWVVKSIIELYNNRDNYYESAVAFINSKCDANGKFLGFFEPNDIINKFSFVNIIGEINVDKLSAIADGVYRFGVAVIDAVLAIFSSVYMLLSREILMRSVGKVLSIFTNVNTVSATKRYLRKIADVFYSYMYGTIIDALIVAVLCIIAFFIIGVDYAPLFGVLVGISNLVPYFGAIVAGVGVSVFVALSEGIIPALITAASILVIQQVDCNVLQPKIVGHSVGLKPIYTLVAITVGGGIFGVGGILLGVPVFATLIMIFNDLAERHYQKLAREDMDQAVEDAVVEASSEILTENKENPDE